MAALAAGQALPLTVRQHLFTQHKYLRLYQLIRLMLANNVLSLFGGILDDRSR